MYVQILREGYDCVEWGVGEVFPSGMFENSGVVGELESAITPLLDSMMFSLCIPWSITCSPLVPLF